MITERNKIMPSIPESASIEVKRWMKDITNVIKELRENIYDDIAILPDWISVTYLNDWVDWSTTMTTAYFKDILGFVHLRLACKNGSTDYPFELPEGFRPTQQMRFPVEGISTSTVVSTSIELYPNGTVMFVDYAPTLMFHGEIIYRAV